MADVQTIQRRYTRFVDNKLDILKSQIVASNPVERGQKFIGGIALSIIENDYKTVYLCLAYFNVVNMADYENKM